VHQHPGAGGHTRTDCGTGDNNVAAHDIPANVHLQKSYSLQSETDVRTEEFRVDNPSWGIGFDVLPLSDDLQSCWFELTVTNMDTMRNETFGYGRDKSFELHQQYPMYTTGPYKISIKGQRVKVDVTAAKRNP
jgi:hypothetical protein